MPGDASRIERLIADQSRPSRCAYAYAHNRTIIQPEAVSRVGSVVDAPSRPAAAAGAWPDAAESSEEVLADVGRVLADGIFWGLLLPQNGLSNLVGRVGFEPTTLRLEVRIYTGRPDSPNDPNSYAAHMKQWSSWTAKLRDAGTLPETPIRSEPLESDH